MRFFILLCMLLLAACFHDDDSTSTLVPPVEFAISLDAPAIGVRHGPTEDIIMTATNALNASSSVDVQLRGPGGDSVPLAISLEGDSLRIDPRLPLRAGYRYTLTVSGLQDLEGNGLFEPFVADILVSLAYTERRETFSATPRLEVTEFNAAGLPARTIRYGDPGIDGDWDTGDEAVLGYTVYDHPALGREIQRRYGDPGDDASWFDGNDTLGYVTHNGTMADGQAWYAVSVNGPGMDGDWGTPDDWLAWALVYGYDELGRATSTSWLEGLGEDILPGTPDDLIREVLERRYEGDAIGWNITFDGPGADGDWGQVADNAIDHYYRWQAAPDCSRIGSRFQSPGPDGEWLSGNDDEREGGHYEREWQQDGWWLYGMFWDGDQVPLSGDEMLDAFYFEKQGELGEGLASGIMWWAGDDGTAFTPDDELLEFSAVERNADGLVTAKIAYDSLGTDPQPLSGDETVSWRYRFTYDALGNMAGQDFISHPGDDGDWGTPDDPVSTRYTFRSYHGE